MSEKPKKVIYRNKSRYNYCIQDRVKSIASVQIRNKDQYIREGDKIDGMAIIGAIDNDRIIFRNLKMAIASSYESKNNKSNNKTNKTFSKVKNTFSRQSKKLTSAMIQILKLMGTNSK